MTYGEAIRAHIALQALAKLQLPLKKAKQLYDLRQKLEPDSTFYSEEEKKLFERYALKDENGAPKVQGGLVTFPDTAARDDFEREFDALRNGLTEIEVKVIHLTEEDVGDQRISAEVIDMLDNIIKFE